MAQTLAHMRRLSEVVRLPTAPVVTDLGGGASTTTDGEGVVVKARVQPLQGREHFQGRQTVGDAPYKVTIPFPLPDAALTLTGAARITWLSRQGDKVLSLTTPPQEIEGQRYLQFIAAEKVD